MVIFVVFMVVIFNFIVFFRCIRSCWFILCVLFIILVLILFVVLLLVYFEDLNCVFINVIGVYIWGIVVFIVWLMFGKR